MGTPVEFVEHEACGSSRLQVFLEEDGSYSGFCFSCNTYVRHPYKDKPDGYKPKVKVKTKEDIEAEIQEILEYPTVTLHDRKLNQSSLAHFGVKIGLSTTDGETPTSYHFPYYKGDTLVRWKNQLRELDSKGKKRIWATGPGKESVDLFGWKQAIKADTRVLYITEGECFTPDTEVLTPEGWVRLEDYSGQEVVQYGQDKSLSFVTPLGVVDKQYTGDLIEYRSGSYYSATTEGHQVVRLKEGEPFKCDSTRYQHLPVPRVGQMVATQPQGDLIARMWAMLSADFTFRKEGDILGTLLKARKIERARQLLAEWGGRYTESPQKDGKVSFFIHRGHGLECSKLFDYGLLVSGSARVLLEELVHWDGNLVPNRAQFEYATKELHNAQFVQTLAHTQGYVSSIIPRSNQHGSWYKVSVLLSKQSSSTHGGYSRVPYSGRAMCLTVPSGMLMVKQRGSISINGNCDAVALYQMLRKRQKGTDFEHNIPAVVSIPGGSSSALSSITAQAEEIRRRFKQVVLVFDQDEPGKKAEEDVLRNFPEFLAATLPGKDANECLIQGHSKQAANAVLFNGSRPKNTRLVWGQDLVQAGRKEAEWGLSYPFPTWTDFTRGLRFGEVIYIGAGVKMGKSELLNALAEHFMLHHNLKVFMAKPEESNRKTFQMLVGKAAGKIFHDPKVPFDFEAYDAYAPRVAPMVCMVDLYQHMGWDTLKADIRDAANQGCKVCFIDPITNLTAGMNASDANTALNGIAVELAAMAKDLDIAVIVFCHLRAPENGLPHERGGAVMSTQFAGSRSMMRSCNYMIGLEGNKDPDLPLETRNTRRIVLLEDREFGNTGYFDINWSPYTGRFEEI